MLDLVLTQLPYLNGRNQAEGGHCHLSSVLGHLEFLLINTDPIHHSRTPAFSDMSTHGPKSWLAFHVSMEASRKLFVARALVTFYKAPAGGPSVGHLRHKEDRWSQRWGMKSWGSVRFCPLLPLSVTQRRLGLEWGSGSTNPCPCKESESLLYRLQLLTHVFKLSFRCLHI